MRAETRRARRLIEIQRTAFVFTTPKGPQTECTIMDISESGLRLDVGDVQLPEIFGISFDRQHAITRVCIRVWRQGEFVGARFASAKELRLKRGKNVSDAIDDHLQDLMA